MLPHVQELNVGENYISTKKSNMPKKYNIIGDIHGRNCWKKLVKDDCINIFVGDYFSPYTHMPFEEQVNNFMDIIMYKSTHPETILLVGNHDEDHWHIHERYSRFDSAHFNEIKELFEENKDYLQAAYSIENKILVSHAGVSAVWYNRYKNHENSSSFTDLAYPEYDEMKTPMDAWLKYYKDLYRNFAEENKHPSNGSIIFWHNQIWLYDNKKNDDFFPLNVTPDEVSDFVNNLWMSGHYRAFNFKNNAGWSDCYGEDKTHGPMWIRSYTLAEVNIFAGSEYAQVVGHTQFEKPATIINAATRYFNEIKLSDVIDKIFFADCLGHTEASIVVEITDNDVLFTVNNGE